jgi:hypothetical protein
VLDDALLLRLARGARALRELGLRGSGVTPEGLRALAAAAEGGAAEEEEGAEEAGGGPGSVDASGSRAAAAGGRAVCGPRTAARGAASLPIELLEVTSSPLCSDDGLAAVGALFPATLRVLAAARGGGALGDGGAAALQGCGRLEELDISGSSVSDEGEHSSLPMLRRWAAGGRGW